jgi:hypothetical protein
MYNRVAAPPRWWRAVADALARRREALAGSGGALYGLWGSQIGRPRDEVTATTVWSAPVTAAQAEAALIGPTAGVQTVASQAMTPTLRPVDAQPPERQGNYAFRWFVTPEEDWPEFLDLCARAWPGFEAAYDSSGHRPLALYRRSDRGRRRRHDGRRRPRLRPQPAADAQA